MIFIYDNGDVNVSLITTICVASIVLFIILISIFSRIRKKEEEELENYYEDDIEEPKSKVVNKPRTPSMKKSIRKSVVKSKPVSKKKVKKKGVVSKTKSAPIKEVLPEVNLNTNDDSNIQEVPTKPIKTKKSNKTPVNKNEKATTKTKEKVKETDIVSNTAKVIEVDNSKKSVKTEEPKSVDKSKVELIDEELSDIPPLVVKPVSVDKVNQKSIKLTKVGDIQVNETISLNEAERKMLSSVISSSDRGHIIQLVGGTKIMDFPIDNMTQLNHIERQIDRFGDVSGNYIVYIIWESNLKHRVKLSQKLRYNPTVRYK